MPTFRLTLEYDGSAYAGWQRQPGQATVEGALRQALAALGADQRRLTAAGRTDAGAHSHGQVVGVQLDREWIPEQLLKAINTHLPEDVAVVAAATAADDFHARFDARSRTYRYVVVPQRHRSPVTRRQAWHITGELDLVAMRRAAALLVGSHDFGGFGRSPQPGGSTTRRVDAVDVARRTIHSADQQAPLDAVVIEVAANAFLYGMMRTIAGALVAVGQHRLTIDDIASMLADAQFSHRHVTVAPAHGLHQWTVTYA